MDASGPSRKKRRTSDEFVKEVEEIKQQQEQKEEEGKEKKKQQQGAGESVAMEEGMEENKKENKEEEKIKQQKQQQQRRMEEKVDGKQKGDGDGGEKEGTKSEEFSFEDAGRFTSERLAEISDGDKSFEKELMDAYRSNSDEKLPLLEKAIADKQKEDCILYAHDIKGSSSNIGATSIFIVSKKMEELLRDALFEEARKLLPLLKEEMNQTYRLMDTYLAE